MQEEMKPREGKGLAQGHTASQGPTAGRPRFWAWVSASRPPSAPELLPPSGARPPGVNGEGFCGLAGGRLENQPQFDPQRL